MSFFLGIDAGGTKTEFLLGDEAHELARVRTGTIQRMRTDAPTAERNLLEALNELAAVTGVSMQSIKRCCIGTSGETVPLIVEWLRHAFDRYVRGELILVGDVEIALDSVFFGGRGVLVLAGTGSNVAGRTEDGIIATAGGWGPVLADQGSGNFIGREALRRGFLAIDQQRPSRVLEAAMSFWKLASIGELIEWANGSPTPDFSQLAPIIVDCASQGDLIAQEILNHGGSDLACLASILIERIRSVEVSSVTRFKLPVVAVAGSILTHVAPVRQALEHSLRERYPEIRFKKVPADPPLGALWRARYGVRPATTVV